MDLCVPVSKHLRSVFPHPFLDLSADMQEPSAKHREDPVQWIRFVFDEPCALSADGEQCALAVITALVDHACELRRRVTSGEQRDLGAVEQLKWQNDLTVGFCQLFESAAHALREGDLFASKSHWAAIVVNTFADDCLPIWSDGSIAAFQRCVHHAAEFVSLSTKQLLLQQDTDQEFPCTLAAAIVKTRTPLKCVAAFLDAVSCPRRAMPLHPAILDALWRVVDARLPALASMPDAPAGAVVGNAVARAIIIDATCHTADNDHSILDKAAAALVALGGFMALNPIAESDAYWRPPPGVTRKLGMDLRQALPLAPEGAPFLVSCSRTLLSIIRLSPFLLESTDVLAKTANAASDALSVRRAIGLPWAECAARVLGAIIAAGIPVTPSLVAVLDVVRYSDEASLRLLVAKDGSAQPILSTIVSAILERVDDCAFTEAMSTGVLERVRQASSIAHLLRALHLVLAALPADSRGLDCLTARMRGSLVSALSLLAALEGHFPPSLLPSTITNFGDDDTNGGTSFATRVNRALLRVFHSDFTAIAPVLCARCTRPFFGPKGGDCTHPYPSHDSDVTAWLRGDRVGLLSDQWCGTGTGVTIRLTIPDEDVGTVHVDTLHGRIGRFSIVACHAFRSDELVFMEATPALVAAERTDATLWDCPECTLKNWGPVCDACGESREPTWTCQACTLINAGRLAACEVCSTPRHRPEVGGGGSDKLSLRCVECGMEVRVSLGVALDLRPHPCPNCRAVDPAYAVVAPMVAARGVSDAPIIRFELRFTTTGTTLQGTVDFGALAQVESHGPPNGGLREFSFPVSFDRSLVPLSATTLLQRRVFFTGEPPSTGSLTAVGYISEPLAQSRDLSGAILQLMASRLRDSVTTEGWAVVARPDLADQTRIDLPGVFISVCWDTLFTDVVDERTIIRVLRALTAWYEQQDEGIRVPPALMREHLVALAQLTHLGGAARQAASEALAACIEVNPPTMVALLHPRPDVLIRITGTPSLRTRLAVAYERAGFLTVSPMTRRLNLLRSVRRQSQRQCAPPGGQSFDEPRLVALASMVGHLFERGFDRGDIATGDDRCRIVAAEYHRGGTCEMAGGRFADNFFADQRQFSRWVAFLFELTSRDSAHVTSEAASMLGPADRDVVSSFLPQLRTDFDTLADIDKAAAALVRSPSVDVMISLSSTASQGFLRPVCTAVMQKPASVFVNPVPVRFTGYDGSADAGGPGRELWSMVNRDVIGEGLERAATDICLFTPHTGPNLREVHLVNIACSNIQQFEFVGRMIGGAYINATNSSLSLRLALPLSLRQFLSRLDITDNAREADGDHHMEQRTWWEQRRAAYTALRHGFSDVVPNTVPVTPLSLARRICGEGFSPNTVLNHLIIACPSPMDQWLRSIITSDFSDVERRMFVQFASGSSLLPLPGKRRIHVGTHAGALCRASTCSYSVLVPAAASSKEDLRRSIVASFAAIGNFGVA